MEMGDAGNAENAGNEKILRVHSSIGMGKPTMSLNHHLELTHLNTSMNGGSAPLLHFPQGFGVEFENRSGTVSPLHNAQIPPLSPYSVVPLSRQPAGGQSYVHSPSHSRSLSQPTFFNLDSLPPLSPSPFRDSPSAPLANQLSVDVSMEDRDGSGSSHLLPPPYTRIKGSTRPGESLPPRKAHRRSNSDIPFGFSMVMQSSLPLLPLKSPTTLEKSASDFENLGKAEPSSSRSGWNKANICDRNVERKSDGEVIDDLFNAYMSLDNIDAAKPAPSAEKKENVTEDLDSRASGSKTNVGDNSDNEAESSINESGAKLGTSESGSNEKREGIKRSAGADIAPTARHYRSISMDSFMGNMHFGQEVPKLPTSPSPYSGGLSPSYSLDKNSNAFSLEFGNGEFSGAELKKIMANDKLAEIALADPKRAKRILANRQSAARSKERKMRYISELEHKVQTLQSEATTLSAQVTVLQRESAGLSSQNNELKFRLQAMEQQAQLRDALNEALSGEVQRLKITTQEISNNGHMYQQPSAHYNLSQPQQNIMNSKHETIR